MGWGVGTLRGVGRRGGGVGTLRGVGRLWHLVDRWWGGGCAV